MNKAIVATEINEPLEMEIGKAIHALEGSDESRHSSAGKRN
jgi:hypothetical protein